MVYGSCSSTPARSGRAAASWARTRAWCLPSSASGTQAAVAPLWNVDDKVANDFAQGFYKAVLKGGTAPAEYLRRRRAGTLGAAGADLSTPLAYLFFGHPRLTVQWTA
ncbi:CHAT domain-containing protein [Streptomyces massasporeus]|uniref:CHAT domain-containing protein n=1 Tax=Streptomyces massasporeus TaxID=67324 RepID=UPI003405FB3F